MPLFVLTGMDRSDAGGRREELRPLHLRWLDSLGPRVLLAGPFLDADGKPCGSMLIVEAELLSDARALASKDPYATENVFEFQDARPWRRSVGEWGAL